MVSICYPPTVAKVSRIITSSYFWMPFCTLCLNQAHFSLCLSLCLGPIWREARSFWLPGPAGSPQCHPQANKGEKPGRGRAQQWRFRLRHQLFWDRPWQPGQLPAMTALDLKPGQELKTKGPFFVLCAVEEQNHRRECNTYAKVSPGFRIGIKLLLYGCCREGEEMVAVSWRWEISTVH